MDSWCIIKLINFQLSGFEAAFLFLKQNAIRKTGIRRY